MDKCKEDMTLKEFEERLRKASHFLIKHNPRSTYFEAVFGYEFIGGDFYIKYLHNVFLAPSLQDALIAFEMAIQKDLVEAINKEQEQCSKQQ